MTKHLRIGRYILYALLTLTAIALFDYWTPSGAVGRIGGTEVKRMDSEGESGTRDVRYITVEMRGSRKTAVFANEDSPFYFLKVNSATVQGRAQNLATRRESTFALIRYYGWRVPLLSMFPNVLSVDEVAEDYTYVPWTKIIAGLVILILLLVIWRRYVRWKNRRAAIRQAELEAERAAQARREAEANKNSVDEFINSGQDKEN